MEFLLCRKFIFIKKKLDLQIEWLVRAIYIIAIKLTIQSVLWIHLMFVYETVCLRLYCKKTRHNY